MVKLKIICTIVLLISASQSVINETDDFLNKLHFESIDAHIQQIIAETGKQPIKYEGRYRALRENLRIDYTKPFPQIVILRGNTLLWYYPETKEVWELTSNDTHILPSMTQIEVLKNRFIIKSKSKTFYGFFSFATRYILEDINTKVQIELLVDSKKGYPVRKIVYNTEGTEVVRESYSKYIHINNIWFPTLVEVIARTQRGIVRNITYYSSVQINVNLSPEIFSLKLPKGVRANKILR